MRRLGLAAALLMGTAGVAMADPCIIDPDFGITYSPDDTSISITPDFFAATRDNPGTCSEPIPAHNGPLPFPDVEVPNDPDLFEVYTATYKGAVEPGDTATLTVEQRGFSDSTQIEGDLAGFEFETFAGKDGDGNIAATTTLTVNSTSDTNEAVIDTLDYLRFATMTRDDAEESVDEIGLARAGLVTHLDATANLLTGANLALEGGDEFGVIGGLGSYMFGGTVRYNLAEGFSVLGGVSIFDMGAGGADAHGVLGAAAIRWVQPDATGFRLFGEGGVQGAGMSMSFSRSYDYEEDNVGPATASASGSGDGLLGAGYLRGGVLIEPDQNNQIVLSASVKQSVLGISNYLEEVSADNPFAADLSGTQASFTTVKAGVDWTTKLAVDVDLTASGAIGSTMGNTGTAAYIFGGGDVVGTPQSALFVEYGARVGWMPTADARLDGFAAGSTGVGIGTHAQVGAAYHMSF